MKKSSVLLSVFLSLLLLISSCKNNEEPVTGSIASSETAAIDTPSPVTTSDVASMLTPPSGGDVAMKLSGQDKEHGDIYEAEQAILTRLNILNGSKGDLNQKFSGEGYVGDFTNTGRVTFTINIPETGSYDISVSALSLKGTQKLTLRFNDDLKSHRYFDVAEGKEFQSAGLTRVMLPKGNNEIEVRVDEGEFYVDCLYIAKSGTLPTKTYDFEVAPELSNLNALDSAKRLYRFLKDNYGKKVITGQFATDGENSVEFGAIKLATGKLPAILGLDFMDYSLSRVERGAVGTSVEVGLEWARKGGILSYCWHWNAPKDVLEPWYKGFYTETTTFDLEKAINGEDPEGYDLLIKDIDNIANQLKRFQNEDIPILWRPLHEGNGKWFWWGAKGPDPQIKLWRLMYDRFTNYHKLNNLIWVWNGQEMSYYPGDEYCDIISMDLYPAAQDSSSQLGAFNTAKAIGNKIIALSECGVIPQIDLMFLDGAPWSFYMSWGGEFVLNPDTGFWNEKYTELSVLKQIYNSAQAITFENLPNLKEYPLD